MIYAYVGLALLFVVWVMQQRATAAERKAWTAEREAWRQERSELLSRIQRPDQIPVAPRPDFIVPDREPDEWNQVGRVVIDPEYGLDETD